MKIASFHQNMDGSTSFFIVNSFNYESGTVKGKGLYPNPDKEVYEFGSEIEENIESFTNGFHLVYEGETTSRIIHYEDLGNFIKSNPLMPRMLQ